METIYFFHVRSLDFIHIYLLICCVLPIGSWRQAQGMHQTQGTNKAVVGTTPETLDL